MNSVVLCRVMNVLLIISSVVSVADTQSEEEYIDGNDECATNFQCWVPAVENFIDNPLYFSNTTVLGFCDVLDEFKLCVDRQQAACDNPWVQLIADNVKAIGNIVCDAAGRSAVQGILTSQCLIDETKQQRLNDAVDTCLNDEDFVCSTNRTDQKRCVREAIHNDCGENGAGVLARVAWEFKLGVLYALLCNQ